MTLQLWILVGLQAGIVALAAAFVAYLKLGSNYRFSSHYLTEKAKSEDWHFRELISLQESLLRHSEEAVSSQMRHFQTVLERIDETLDLRTATGEEVFGPTLLESGQASPGLFECRVWLEAGLSSVNPVIDYIENLFRDVGIEIIFRSDPIRGSWRQTFLAFFRRAKNSEDVRRALVEVQRALELQTVDVPQSIANKNNAEAAAAYIEATRNEDSVMQLGTLVVIRSKGRILTRQLTQRQLLALEKQSDLLLRPDDMLVWVAALNDPPDDRDDDSGPERLMLN